MVTNVMTGAIVGVNGHLVVVEMDVSAGLPCMEMVGSLGSEVREAKERVRVALKNSGISIPPMRITVNLSPADLRKEGTGYDLPIAIALMAALGIVPEESVEDVFVVGELGLSGEVKSVKGILPLVLMAKEHGIKKILVPNGNVNEASVVPGIMICGIEHLMEATEVLSDSTEEKKKWKKSEKSVNLKREKEGSKLDYSDLLGQEGIKRVMQIAAAGFHNVLLIGPPGSGKTMAAKRLTTILPPLSLEESMEVSKIYSVVGLLKEEHLITKRPFVSPHHTISPGALTGAGKNPKPGLISRAHKGILYLDEVVHFSSEALENLRQPLEEKKILISRSGGNYEFPADFMLVASMNPCPCGYFPDFSRCRCSPEQIKRYRGKMSGPILDRIDLLLEVPPVPLSDMKKTESGTGSETLRQGISRAREMQRKRYRGREHIFNSQLTVKDMEKYILPEKGAEDILRFAYEKGKLSLRGYHRVMKVARTIADLDGEEQVLDLHVQEALGYRERVIP